MTPELELRLKSLEKALEDIQNAFRRVAQETNGTLSVVAKVSENVSTLRAEVDLLKLEAKEKAKKELSLGRTNY